MSISTVRNFLEKSGCALVVSIMLAIMFIVGFLWMSSPAGQQAQGNAPTETVIAEVAGNPITLTQVEELTRQQTQQYFAQLESVPIELEASVMGGVLRQLVNQSLVTELAKRDSVNLSDDDVLSMVKSQFEATVKSEKDRLVTEGKLTAAATDDVVDKVFKEVNGTTLTELRQKNLDDAKNLLADPKGRANVISYFTNQALINARKSRLTPSDEQLKTSFDTLVVKRILFDGAKGNAMESATKAVAEIKGGLSFEQAIDRYSTDTPEKGKKLSEVTTNFTVASIEGLPTFQSVLALKGGEISPPLASGTGALVYKLVERKGAVPADFETAKASYADGYATQAANRQVTADVQKMYASSDVIVWKSEGYRVLFDYASMMDASDANAQGDAFVQLEERAAQASTSDPIGSKPAALVRYLALQRLPSGKTPEEQAALKQKKIEAIGNLLVTSENFDLRMQLVDILLEDKDALAADELLAAARNNNSPTEIGQRNFSDSVVRLDKLKAASLGTPEKLKAIDDEFERWRRDKKDYDQGQAEIKRLEEEDKKRAEAEAKAEAAKGPKPPSSGDLGTAPPPKGN